MAPIRAVASVWLVLQVTTYNGSIPYPPGHATACWVLAVVFPVASALLARWVHTPGRPSSRGASLLGMGLDAGTVAAFLFIYAFDQTSSIWALAFLVVAEAAVKFSLTGALVAAAASTLTYIAREVWAQERFAHEIAVNSVTFRMGIVLFVAAIMGTVVRQLLTALTEVSRSEQWRSRLVMMLAHDVRSPLAAISMQVDGLALGPDLISEEDRQVLVDGVRRQAGRLTLLAGGLLDLARAESGTLVVEPDDVEVGPVLDRVRQLTSERVDVVVEDDLVVHADRERLEQVLVNLVTNALRHGEPPVTLEATREGPDVVLRVTDQGGGVGADLEASLFEPFSTAHGEGSVGLGLWIVRELVEAHDGTVIYVGGGVGACFEVRLRASHRHAEVMAHA